MAQLAPWLIIAQLTPFQINAIFTHTYIFFSNHPDHVKDYNKNEDLHVYALAIKLQLMVHPENFAFICLQIFYFYC